MAKLRVADITSWLDPKSVINYLDLDRVFCLYPFFGILIFSVYRFCFAIYFWPFAIAPRYFSYRRTRLFDALRHDEVHTCGMQVITYSQTLETKSAGISARETGAGNVLQKYEDYTRSISAVFHFTTRYSAAC